LDLDPAQPPSCLLKGRTYKPGQTALKVMQAESSFDKNWPDLETPES